MLGEEASWDFQSCRGRSTALSGARAAGDLGAEASARSPFGNPLEVTLSRLCLRSVHGTEPEGQRARAQRCLLTRPGRPRQGPACRRLPHLSACPQGPRVRNGWVMFSFPS